MTDDALRATMEALRLDRLAVEVAEALDEAGCVSVLLKGASTARWLYDDGTPRGYVDVDLLVARPDTDRVGAVLADLGFTSLTPGLATPDLDHAETWVRRANEFVDLHFTLPSAGDASPEHVWAVLADHHEPWSMAGGRIRVLGPEARSVVLVLHAIHHGPAGGTPVTDLRRLLARLGRDDWSSVAALARRLGVEREFAAGLRLVPEGVAVAAALGLPEVTTPELWLKSAGVFDGAHVLERLARSGGPVAALRLVVGEVFPHPAELRWYSALAHRGLPGLVAAYLVRPFLLLVRLPGVVRSWSRARRGTRGVARRRRAGREAQDRGVAGRGVDGDDLGASAARVLQPGVGLEARAGLGHPDDEVEIPPARVVELAQDEGPHQAARPRQVQDEEDGSVASGPAPPR